jgi:hypothetical protein
VTHHLDVHMHLAPPRCQLYSFLLPISCLGLVGVGVVGVAWVWGVLCVVCCVLCVVCCVLCVVCCVLCVV